MKKSAFLALGLSLSLSAFAESSLDHVGETIQKLNASSDFAELYAKKQAMKESSTEDEVIYSACLLLDDCAKHLIQATRLTFINQLLEDVRLGRRNKASTLEALLPLTSSSDPSTRMYARLAEGTIRSMKIQ